MAGKGAAAASSPAGAAVGAPTPPPAQRRAIPQVGAPHTLHIEYAVWSKSWRLVHTRPDGSRDIHRRGIPNLRDAKIKAQMASGLTGWEYTDE